MNDSKFAPMIAALVLANAGGSAPIKPERRATLSPSRVLGAPRRRPRRSRNLKPEWNELDAWAAGRLEMDELVDYQKLKWKFWEDGLDWERDAKGRLQYAIWMTYKQRMERA